MINNSTELQSEQFNPFAGPSNPTSEYKLVRQDPAIKALYVTYKNNGPQETRK